MQGRSPAPRLVVVLPTMLLLPYHLEPFGASHRATIRANEDESQGGGEPEDLGKKRIFCALKNSHPH
ncbi:hypothetical protein ASPCADRAFT_203204 [Aspergillus carbonarius ITEM 5010]|uniref:Uncharacterized protein n=1 Tax=Aspergillus carbonarius (strain ITEM 5010) TaxID=602072 RepID=A0A1R3RY65_ASPC5|nr:hypothetical protein ASPCADRAFT_203204 [Aspergillus carbonarius ITEM 5010]